MDQSKVQSLFKFMMMQRATRYMDRSMPHTLTELAKTYPDEYAEAKVRFDAAVAQEVKELREQLSQSGSTPGMYN